MGKQLSIRESNAKKIALRKMEEYFGYTSFQENQAAPITELFLEKDVFAVMPTASGKSICYQLPAIYFRKEKKKGITIVVEPVKALMDNQVRDLNKQMDHVAAAIHSGMPFNAYDNIKKHSETICLIYVAPERLANPDFHQLLEECFNWDVVMIVVDEAHTMSLWGHGFRPEYRRIPRFINTVRKRTGHRPILAAFTATATDYIANDIRKLLMLKVRDTSGFTVKERDVRANLDLHVRKMRRKYDTSRHTVYEKQLEKDLARHKGELGIIYCCTVMECVSVFQYLSSKCYRVAKYHGSGSSLDDTDQHVVDEKGRHSGLDRENAEALRQFMRDEIDIIVATSAFGMGIDKKPEEGRDVTFIIHHTMPGTIEDYVQQAGRAGRHTKDASCECIMYYNENSHAARHLFLLKKNAQQYMLSDRLLLEGMARERLHHMNRIAAESVSKGTQGCIDPKQILRYFSHFEDEITPELKQLPVKKNLPEEIFAGSTGIHIALRKKDARPKEWVAEGTITIRKGQKSTDSDIKENSEKGARKDYYEFRDEMPDYFDMMVLDALYTLYQYDQSRGSVSDSSFSFDARRILQTLAGDTKSDLHKSPLLARISHSMARLREMEVYIGNDPKAGAFLPMLPSTKPSEIHRGKRAAACELSNDYTAISPLFRHLEIRPHPYNWIVRMPTEYMGHNAPPATNNLTEDNLKLQYYILYRICWWRKVLDNARNNRSNDKELPYSRSINIEKMLDNIGVIPPVESGSHSTRSEKNHRRIWDNRLLEKIDKYLGFLKGNNVIASYEFKKHGDNTHHNSRLYRSVKTENEKGEYTITEFQYILFDL